MKNLIILLLLLMLSACTSNSSVFTEFMDKDKVCNLFSDELIKTTFNIKEDIENIGHSMNNIMTCYVSWNTGEDESMDFMFQLVSVRPGEDFPPKKLKEKQLLKKIALANKSMEASLSGFGQALIDRTQRNTADGIRSHNDYKILDELGDSAIITKLVLNNAYMQSMAGDLAEKQADIIDYKLSVKSGNIIFHASLSTEVISNPNEHLIQLVTQTLKGK